MKKNQLRIMRNILNDRIDMDSGYEQYMSVIARTNEELVSQFIENRMKYHQEIINIKLSQLEEDQLFDKLIHIIKFEEE